MYSCCAGIISDDGMLLPRGHLDVSLGHLYKRLQGVEFLNRLACGTKLINIK